MKKNRYSGSFQNNNNNSIDIPCCRECKDPNFIYLECFHEICSSCFNKKILKDLYNSKCKVCDIGIRSLYIKEFIGDNKYAQLESKLLQEILVDSRIINCSNIKCNEKIIYEKGNVNYNQTDNENKKMSNEACENYANNRCRCPTCKTEFCVNCDTTPYHLGKTCEEYQNYQNALKCKFCDEEIKNSNKGPGSNCCTESECVERYRESCKKKLKCTHDCPGHVEENFCLPCIITDCDNYENFYGQTSEDYCPICYSESLISAPLVKTGCNHFVHHACVKEKIFKKWVGPKLTFNYMECSQCKSWLTFPNNSDLQKLSDENKALYDDIIKKLTERMKFEGLDKDKRLSDPNDPFYQKPLEFGLKSIAYYMCFKCKKPYFAGLRNCREDENANNREHDPSHLLCGGCGALDGVAGISNCKKHGKEFITYKCKFCCNESSWFCWGTTHFCDSCHKRQCNHDYVTKIPKDKLPKCPGPGSCKVKTKHPPNGEEFALGCTICRNEADNMKNF